MMARISLNNIEKVIAAASFLVAAALAFTALLITDEHEIAAGVCMVIAQFLLLTAAALHIDLKLNDYERTFRTPK